jgi:hypothetical protein
VVLGALLLGVIVLFVSCSVGGNDNTHQRGQGTATSSPLPVPSTPDDTPSFSDAKPGSGPSLPAPNDIDSNQPSLGDGNGDGTSGTGLPATPPAGGANLGAAAPTGDTCADTEMSVTPVPGSTTVKRGVPVNIKLIIKNIGTRTCSRDVGAGPQELYIDQGARKYWSSDTCSTANGSDVVKFTPGMEREYNATWNGRQSSTCTGGTSGGPAPPPGVYEIRGRLASKISDPVSLTISA